MKLSRPLTEKRPPMKDAQRGDVWLVNLGLAAKVRPCLVLNVPTADEDRALNSVVAHTTSTRGTRFEVSVKARFLHPGALDAQNLFSVARAKFIKKLGTLTASQLADVEAAVRTWLGL